jgi:hypothetical protein
VQPIEYGMPFAATSRLPPLWIGIVGHETILPVRAIAPPETVSDSDTSAAAAGWRTALRYAEAVVVEEKDPAVIFPAGQLHTAATLLLLAILVWLMAQAFPAPSKEARRSPRRWLRQLAFPALQAFVARRRPLLSAPPPAIAACDELARPYLSIQLLAWEALVAVYVAAVAPLVAPFSAEIRILAPFGGSPPAHALALVLWILSVAVLLSFLGILHVRLRRLGKAKCSPSFPGAFGWHAAPLCWFGGAAVLAISMWFGFGVLRASPEEQIFLWVRTSNWLSGVSPTLPLVFFGLGITATAHLRRLELAAIERAGIRLSSLLAPQNSTLVDLEGRAGRIAEGRYLTRTGRLVAVTAATATILVLTRLRPTVEGDAWTLLMEFLLAAVVAGLVHGIVLLIQVWYTTRRTLDQIAAHPIAATYIRLRERLAGVIGLHPFGAAPRSEPLEARVRTCVARLRATPGDPDDALIHDETLAAAAHLAGTGWEAPSDADRPKLEVRSELVALQVARTLLQRVSLIRALVGALTINGLVLLLSTRIYPFQPHSLLSALAWALVLLVVAACVWTLLEMERDAMLSYLSGSEPGKITWDSGFVSQLLVYSGLPLLALVAAHFPEVGKPLFDWIRPVAGSLK